MRVLSFTSLFPNAAQPLLGLFVQQRVVHFAKRPGNIVRVIAPVPYFPSWLPVSKWRKIGRIPKQEEIAGLNVYHPRYPLLPKISMPLQAFSMAAASFALIRRLHRETGIVCIDAH